jgi:UDP-glucose 4-epimerase
MEPYQMLLGGYIVLLVRKMLNKSVLVTGAHGFIGRHVAKFYSQQGWHVTGIGHGEWRKNELSDWGIKDWFSADVSIKNLLDFKSSPDVVVHTAGGSSVPFSLQHPYADFNKTVISTIEILEFLRLHKPDAKLVYLSTAGVYGSAEILPIKESAELKPLSPYGAHKLIAENLCAQYSEHYELSTAVIRFFSIYGSGLRKQLLWDASNKAISGQLKFFGRGDEIRDWLHVNDAVKLIYKVAEQNNKDCLVLNGGSGIGVSVNQLLIQLFANLNVISQPQFTGVVREGDPKGYIADTSISIGLGFKPQMQLSEGLEEYVTWFLGTKHD